MPNGMLKINKTNVCALNHLENIYFLNILLRYLLHLDVISNYSCQLINFLPCCIRIALTLEK